MTKRTVRRGRIFPDRPADPALLAQREAARNTFFQSCWTIFEKVHPELSKDHYNWFILIEPQSGDYFIDPQEELAIEKARQKYPQGMLGTFRLNHNGACGKL